MKAAVVHGNYLAHGGGEVVSEAIAEALDAPIFYGFGDPSVVPDSSVEHHCLFDDIPRVFHRFCHKPMVRDAAFFRYGQRLPELQAYDILVLSGNEFAWYPPPDGQTTLRYVHSPPRGAFDQFQSRGVGLSSAVVQTAIRTMFEPTNSYHDRVVANSELVARRCRRFFGREASVLYPPIDVPSFNSSSDRDEYYLTLSRLSPNKRIGEIVSAFSALELPLKVAGDGPLRDELEDGAGDCVEFCGYVSEEEKRELLANAKAFVFNARDEDFGIVPVEAMASGCPVIGVNEGFTAHQIVDGWNGLTYDSSGLRSKKLFEAVHRFECDGVTASPQELRAFARKHFDCESFEKQLRFEVDRAVEESKIRVPWRDIAARVAADGGSE